MSTSAKANLLPKNSLVEFDPKVLGGSIKRNIVNPDLVDERKKTAFDKIEFASFMIGEEVLEEIKEIRAFIEAEP
jgi:hypothetical protein